MRPNEQSIITPPEQITIDQVVAQGATVADVAVYGGLVAIGFALCAYYFMRMKK